jgi:hypothetical protein
MRPGTLIATRDDGAQLIYDGLLDLAGIKEIPVAHIEWEGRKGPVVSVLGGLVHGGWHIELSDAEWEQLNELMNR